MISRPLAGSAASQAIVAPLLPSRWRSSKRPNARVGLGEVADVCAENQVYAEFLRALAAISSGSFDPQNIAEVWNSDEGPITVAFTLAGARHDVHPAYSNDWMDLDILAPINTLLSTHQFACWGMDQTAIVVCLPRDALKAFKSSELLPLEWLCV